MYHPWRRLRGLDDWLLEWDQLPEGISGEINWPTHTITIDPRLSQAQRRCTLAHELEHVVRGPGGGPREEREVEGMAARRLVNSTPLWTRCDGRRGPTR
ncbi:ImmA/IrrE family metallo-endopeptidase [Cutibacterium avidum]|uniref:ImmA/IrrE family metallo-endopeptidase n=1 Tax=Cutibacterium avidum TaxID=33010 RepID=UPI001C844C79